VSATYSLPKATLTPLGSLSVARSPSCISVRAGANESLRGALLRRDSFDLVVVSVSHVQPAVAVCNSERVLQPNYRALAVAIAKLEEVLSDYRVHAAVGIEVRGTYRADLAIRKVELFAVAGDA